MKPFLYIACFVFLFTCSNSTENENCKYLLSVSFTRNINLSLPEYSQLQFACNSIYIPNLGGNKGVIVANTGADFLAWDATDPNHIPSDCSRLINSNLEATCGCEEGNTYSLVNGYALKGKVLPCGLKNYRVEKTGNMLYISN